MRYTIQTWRLSIWSLDAVSFVQAFKKNGEINKTAHGALKDTDMSLENPWDGDMSIEEFS